MIDPLSLTAVPLELLGPDDKRCARASGFFYKRDAQHVYLVTNWHVVTGRNPHKPNLTPLDYVPRLRARALAHSRQPDIPEPSIHAGAHSQIDIDLNSVDGDDPQWLEHPLGCSHADIAVLEVDREKLDNATEYQVIAECDLTPAYREAVMDDICIIGYPRGLTAGEGLILPLYKRGSIASEPSVNKRFIFIDGRTDSAMSGSPAICTHSGFWAPNRDIGTATVGTIKKFVGVYSGRLSVEADGNEMLSAWQPK